MATAQPATEGRHLGWDPERPIVVGHRGAPTHAPANTLEALDAALQLGADLVEIDVRATLDNELVLHHDPLIGRKRLRRLTHAQAQRRAEARGTRLATLEQALHALGNAPVNIELKTQDATERLVETVHEHGNPRRTLVTAFHPAPLERIHDAQTPIQTGLLLSPARALWLLYRREKAQILQRQVDQLRVDALIAHKSFLTLRLLAPLEATGCTLLVWTVNRSPLLRRLIVHPLIDGVITDRTDRAVHLRRIHHGPRALARPPLA